MDVKTLRLSFRSSLGGIAIVSSGIIGSIDWAARADFVASHFSWLRSMAMTVAQWFPYPSLWWLPILLSGLGLIWWDVTRRDQISNFRVHVAQQEEANETDLRVRIVGWLKSLLVQPNLRINQAFLFGSIVHDHYSTSDVDLIVEFEFMTDQRFTALVRKIKGEIAKEFQLTFSHKLHVTFFCSNEGAQLDQFLTKAGKYEVIKGGS